MANLPRRSHTYTAVKIRPFDVPRRLPGVLATYRGQLDEDRLLKEGRGVDETPGQRERDWPGRDSRLLVRVMISANQ